MHWTVRQYAVAAGMAAVGWFVAGPSHPTAHPAVRRIAAFVEAPEAGLALSGAGPTVRIHDVAETFRTPGAAEATDAADLAAPQAAKGSRPPAPDGMSRPPVAPRQSRRGRGEDGLPDTPAGPMDAEALTPDLTRSRGWGWLADEVLAARAREEGAAAASRVGPDFVADPPDMTEALQNAVPWGPDTPGDSGGWSALLRPGLTPAGPAGLLPGRLRPAASPDAADPAAGLAPLISIEQLLAPPSGELGQAPAP